MNRNQLQIIWDGLSPEERTKVHGWIIKNTQIEQASFDVLNTELENYEDITGNDQNALLFENPLLPRYHMGSDLRSSSDEIQLAAVNCEKCSEWYLSTESTLDPDLIALDHALSCHLEDILGRQVTIPEPEDIPPLTRILMEIDSRISDRNPEKINDILQELKEYVYCIQTGKENTNSTLPPDGCPSYVSPSLPEKRFTCPECGQSSPTMEETHIGAVYFLMGAGDYDNPNCDNVSFRHTRCPKCEKELPLRAEEYEVRQPVESLVQSR